MRQPDKSWPCKQVPSPLIAVVRALLPVSASMRFWVMFAASVWPAWAHAQLVGLKPTVIVQTVEAELLRINLQELDENASLELSWTTSLPLDGNTYEYELTLDTAATTADQNPVRLVVEEGLDLSPNAGSQLTGQKKIKVKPSEIVKLVHQPGTSSVAAGVDDFERKIFVRVYRSGNKVDENTAQNGSWTFRYDTKRPPSPTVTGVVPGENRVQVSWDAPTSVSDVDRYEIEYCPALDPASESVAGRDLAALCEKASTDSSLSLDTFCESSARKTKSSTELKTSLEDDVKTGFYTVFAIRSVDEFANSGSLGGVECGVPINVLDFFEYHRELGGNEDGGFCFIATAAHGSYAHPTVQVLRAFRDGVMRRSVLGTSLIWAYYRLSPPVARQVAEEPALAATVRVMLLPVALVAGAILWAPLFLLGLIGWRLASRVRISKRVWATASLVVLMLGAAQPALAARPESDYALGFGFEFRGGPYRPAMAGSDAAFQTIYGSGGNPLYTLGAELQLWRGLGTLGVGGSFGFMQFVGKGLQCTPATNDTCAYVTSGDTTVFNIAPLSLTAIYRFDWLVDHSPIPLAPYLRGGLAYHLWWATTGTGSVARSEGDKAMGGKLGVTGSLGVALWLNALDHSSAQALYSATGIRSTYFFAELNGNQVNGFGGEGFDLSDFTWNMGLFVEL